MQGEGRRQRTRRGERASRTKTYRLSSSTNKSLRLSSMTFLHRWSMRLAMVAGLPSLSAAGSVMARLR